MVTIMPNGGFRYTVLAYSNNSVRIYLPKKKRLPKHNIILTLFKCCVSKITLIVLITYLKYTYDHIDQINK